MMGEISLPGVELITGPAPKPCRAESASSDFLSMGYALRHIDDVGRRVLQNSFGCCAQAGRVLVLEISKPAGPVGTALLKVYMRAIVPAIGAAWVARAGAIPPSSGATTGTRSRPASPPSRCWARCAPPASNRQTRHVELGIFSEYVAVKPG